MKLTDLRSLFRETSAYAGQEITVCGWVRNRRDSKVFGFIMLNDGSLQILLLLYMVKRKHLT